ncbi:hypothetical protein PN441_05645 [Spirulina major CS-329]|uniref:hypothetical protein n=1 Tax=Spirulina TaxID=1154 RepID=UPI00232A81B9|nr:MULTISPECIES: hypothetical protein [Spirulina]MDB9493171.1 hypothetical protein [Spirulina subsalsa CS-330]MDB9502549.1 hypothetical protein [Spirulina major CS-329]
MSNSAPNLNALFNTAHAEGSLSTASMHTLNVIDIGAEIQAGLGVNINDVSASEVVLVTIMPDDSSSIRFGGNAQAVRGGHNSVIDALMATQQKDNLLIHTRYLNGHVLYPYCPLEQAVRMTPQNYNPNQGTPLYDQTVVLLGTVLAKTQEFEDNGVPVRTLTLIITDGADEHSQRSRANDVKTLVGDMLRAEKHIVAAMGIEDQGTDFRTVFQTMGIRDEWILTPGNSDREIRNAFQVFSQSVLSLSQGSPGLRQSLGGFGG